MRAAAWITMTGGLGLCLLSLPLLRLGWARLATRPSAPICLAAPAPPRTPSEKARRAGWQCWIRAQQAVNQEREDMEAWDPALGEMNEEPWRRQLVARDRGGELRRGRELARQAAALARTPDQLYWATLLRAHLAHEAGDHAAELHEARTLMALAPRNPISRIYQWRAAACNGLGARTPQSAGAPHALEGAPDRF